MIHPKKLHPRRHVFQGNANGVAAHIRRPKDLVLPVKASCSLPTIGGHCEDSVGHTTLDKWVEFESASTMTHGDFVDLKEGVATTLGEIPFDVPHTETHVTARVRDLVILGRVGVGESAIGLIGRSNGKADLKVRLEGNVLDGVRIDQSKLKATLAEGFFCEHDTLQGLREAFERGLPEELKRMFLPAGHDEEEVKGFPESHGIVKCTIVQKLEWDGPEHPTARIHGHVVVVPNFGKIYFGEMFVQSRGRRLTMVRFQLGSDDGGEVTASDGGTFEQPWPPSGG